MNNVKMMSNTFRPEFNNNSVDMGSFIERNIFYFIIAVVIIFLIYFGYKLIKERDNKIPVKLKPSVEIRTVSDQDGEQLIENSQIDCPPDLKRYSFAFFLDIDDFYCNRGYWKCVLIKGSRIRLKFNKCNYATNNPIDNEFKNDQTNGEFCFKTGDPYVQFNEKCQEKYNNCVTELKAHGKHKHCDKLHIKNKEDLIGLKEDGLFERLDKICRAHDAGERGIDLLCCGVSKCGYFKDPDNPDNSLKMTDGQCKSFVNKHKDYCNKVYALDKKVARIYNSNELAEAQGEEKYYDDFDNSCSADNLMEKYPELIPMEYELGKINLVNLAEKYNNEPDNIEKKTTEGCYNISDLKDKFGNNLLNGYTYDDELSSKRIYVNNETLKEGNNYFAMIQKENTGEEEAGTGEGAETKRIDYEGYTISKELEEILDRSKKINDKDKCDYKKRVGLDTNHYFVSKAILPEDYAVFDCWRSIIDLYPEQTPGVWVHPFVNDLRIVLTTQHDNDIDFNQLLHASKGKTNNYDITKYNNTATPNKEAEYSPTDSSDAFNCIHSDLNDSERSKGNKYKFREYFDIKNIPIKEKFHLSLIINNSVIEVYINGKLKTTQHLYGDPIYSHGPLQLNTGRNGEKKHEVKLGGEITHFKFIPHALNYQNIQTIMGMGSPKQKNAGIVHHIDHAHTIEISHEHPHEVELESEHKHSVHDDDINKSYYLED